MDVFEAIADPTRRGIIGHLSRGPMDASEIANRFEISQPGISRHLKRLLDSGLVNRRVEGQRRIYSLEPDGIRKVDAWARSQLTLWETSLDKMKVMLEEDDDCRFETTGKNCNTHRVWKS